MDTAKGMSGPFAGSVRPIKSTVPGRPETRQGLAIVRTPTSLSYAPVSDIQLFRPFPANVQAIGQTLVDRVIGFDETRDQLSCAMQGLDQIVGGGLVFVHHAIA